MEQREAEWNGENSDDEESPGDGEVKVSFNTLIAVVFPTSWSRLAEAPNKPACLLQDFER